MTGRDSAFHVPLSVHWLSGFVQHTHPLWIALGNLETSTLRDQLKEIEIDRPVYVTGLARAGTTILLEFLAGHAGVATHKYRDFPGVLVPVWWDKSYGAKSTASVSPQERAHGDRIAVTPDSPEAIEECIWMAFFRDAHNSQSSSILNGDVHSPKFEQFYRDHIRKLLLVRSGTRYVAKGNYNLTRLQYLQKLFPNARFVVAIRQPRSHIASLMKQHRLFCNGEANQPRALAYMQRVGHYEFGLDRRAINAGNTKVVRDVEQLWRQGKEVRGWARYWASLYGWFFELLQDDAGLNEAVEVVRFEDLCEDPQRALERIQTHCDLPDPQRRDTLSAHIAAPSYYEPKFTLAEERAIAEETERVASLWRRESLQAVAGATG